MQTQVFRGPNYWSYEPCVRMLVDLGSLEEWPSNQIPGFNEGLLALLPGVARALLLARPAGRLRRAARGRDLARPRRRARGARAPAGDRGAHLARQDAERRGDRPLQRDLRLLGGDRRRRGRQARRPGREPRGQGGEGLRLPRRARAPDQAGGAAGVRPLDPGDHRRGGVAGHPLDASERALAGPARPGEVPAADPRHDDVDDVGPRGRHRVGQEDDEPAARGGGAPGPAERGGPDRRRGGRRPPGASATRS